MKHPWKNWPQISADLYWFPSKPKYGPKRWELFTRKKTHFSIKLLKIIFWVFLGIPAWSISPSISCQFSERSTVTGFWEKNRTETDERTYDKMGGSIVRPTTYISGSKKVFALLRLKPRRQANNGQKHLKMRKTMWTKWWTII